MNYANNLKLKGTKKVECGILIMISYQRIWSLIVVLTTTDNYYIIEVHGSKIGLSLLFSSLLEICTQHQLSDKTGDRHSNIWQVYSYRRKIIFSDNISWIEK